MTAPVFFTPFEGPASKRVLISTLSERIVLPIFVLAWLVCLGSASANSNHRVAWSAYETSHFKIVFHQDVKPQADLAKDFLEQAYARISKDMGVADKDVTITVVLTGIPDESNGYSTPLGHRIVIFTRPGQVIASGEIAWMKRVLAHELAHQITFLALRKSFLGIYSELYKTSHMPSWFLEGVAQYEAESWDAKRNTFFAHVLYNSALEPYPNLATYTKEDEVSGRILYEQGHAFVRFLAHRQGPGFLGPLLRRIRVIPVWTELKEIFSPLTASILPLEDAIGDRTGEGIGSLYREFLDSMQAALPPLPGVGGKGGSGARADAAPPRPLFGGVPGFAAVYQIKAVDSGDFFFTGQRKWDQPSISLFRYRAGKVEAAAPGFVNPVFDLSPDGKRLLYTRSYENADGDPVEKLFLQDLGSGRHYLADGAYHPVFLGNDSIAYSRYRNGRQALLVCALAGGGAACADVSADSLAGYYALSRSSRGLLCNATDTAGRTGVYEYRPGAGITRIFQDTVPGKFPGEFPVEAEDGRIWMLRERNGSMQVEAFNPADGSFAPLSAYPLGTFYLHRAAPGRIVSVVQTGLPGEWGLAPVAALPRSVAPDSAADPVSRAPAFLHDPSPAVTRDPPPAKRAVQHPYHSLLEVRPLIVWPTLAQDFPSVAPAFGVILEDPLQLHTLEFTGTLLVDGPGYDLSYTNRQTPVAVTLAASNLSQIATQSDSVPPWTDVYLVERLSRYSLEMIIPLPFDLPLPHGAYLGLKAEERIYDDVLAARLDTTRLAILDHWSRRVEEFVPQVFLGYGYQRPYSYNFVHPLLATDLELGYAQTYPDNGPTLFWYARQTVPVWDELTYTLRYQGQWLDLDFTRFTAELPDGGTEGYYRGFRHGLEQQITASLDAPIYKGYLLELPVFGPVNYVGGGLYGDYSRASYAASPYREGSGDHGYQAEAGAKLSLLCFPLRRAPLVVSPAVQWDFRRGQVEYRLRAEFSGLSDTYNLFPGRKPSLGSRRDRLP